MTGIFEAAWVIARRDFVATVWSRSFILFLLAPLVVFAVALISGQLIDAREGESLRPQVAVIADGATTRALGEARTRLVTGTSEWSFPILRPVDPAENLAVQAGRLLADGAEGYSAVFSGTLDRPVLTGPAKVDETVGRRMQLLVDEARRTAALEASHQTPPPVAIERVMIDQSAGNLQMTRRLIARAVQMMIFGITVLLATLLLSNMAEEKSNKVIEVLAAAVPLDSVFLGKLAAMLGISFVGLALWGGLGVLAYVFVQMVQDWVTLPQVAPAVGWPAFILLVLFYYGTNYMLLGALFLGIGAQASNIREIQTISMPVTLLQVVVVMIAVAAVGDDGGALAWFAAIFPFSSPLAMIAQAARYESLWPHLLALVWQAIWVVVIIRASARLFRRTVLKSAPGGAFFSLDFWRAGSR
ncbi:ABC transporter permease [Sphingosinicella sp. LHD-64]|uniref:ABC transporter permease n=1 Tax=Sphingosinicella sp. LHD-64 TaxID=3072139 RepID=UPI00280F87F6|nr:ABC transporter permease [Sphingosinicella sp. LHD-64]MDQ8756676.1 ABC transporter permease [Sphingosinicella sp. LHD-64]